MKKRLVVIGGVAAGLKSAAKARRCDPEMEITVYQEEDEISYAGCGLPYYVEGLIPQRKLLISRPLGKFAQDGIDVKKRRRVEKVDPESRTLSVRDLDSGEVFPDRYDRLVFATGARPIRPAIEGVDLGNVFFLRSIFDADALLDQMRKETVRNVVIVGGGYIGLELAEALTELKKTVTLVELAPQILTLFDPDLAAILQRHLESKGVRIFTSEGLQAIEGEDGRVTGVRTASRAIGAEAVILSLGVRPRVDLAREAGLRIGETGAVWVNRRMETSAEGVYAAGDCAETTHLVTGKPTWVPLGSTANKQGRVVGINVCGGDAAFSGVLGTTIFKAFDFGVAKTGFNMREAAREGFEPVQAVVRGYGQAHYYPGGRESVLKVIADRATGRILGGQAVGNGPSDKFIDILAMAIHGGMTCFSLPDVDLAYAPPFSPALSPVTVAAYVLQNKLEGRFEGITVSDVREKLEADPEGFSLVDVREKWEVEKKRIPGSVWIPLGEIRGRAGELDRGREVAVHCESGLRSYKACLSLRYAGFDKVKNVDGGMLCWLDEKAGESPGDEEGTG